MKLRALLIVALALLSVGCTADILGRMKGFDVQQIVLSQPVIEAVARGRNIGRIAAGVETLLLAFYCWYRIQVGAPWISIGKDWLLGVVSCAYILTTVGTPAGVARWIWNLGVALGELFNPGGGFLMENYDKAVGEHAEQVLYLKKVAPLLGDDQRRLVETVLWSFSSPFMAGVVWLNAVGIYLMKMIVQVSYAWLISFYWMLTPLVAPMVILPQTRGVFVGWLKAYISVTLWPVFFAFAERLAIAIPWSAWLGSFDSASDVWDIASAFAQGELMLLIFNVTFFFVYLSIPIASYMIVSGASRPFRLA
jgi:hypothetical protein